MCRRAAGVAFDGVPGTVWFLGKPATNWEKEAFPLGNGRLGCMVFGGVEEERIQFNVDSLWTGDENLPGDYGAPGMGQYQNFGNLHVVLDVKGQGKRRRNQAFEETYRETSHDNFWTYIIPEAVLC